MITATATEVQNNFGHYLQYVQSGEEIVILNGGKEVARLVAYNSITDALTGVLKNDYDDKAMHAERIKAREDFD